MSPNINSFVGDLVAMAQAVEELPKVQLELRIAQQANDEFAHAVEARELAIMRYKQQIEDLNAKVRSLEVERDDASFRVLEAEDKAHNVLAMAKAARVSLEQMTGLLDPPKPEPEPEVPLATRVQIELDPIGDIVVGSGGASSMPLDWKQDQAETSRLPQGSSEGNPSATTISANTANPSADVNSEPESSQEPSASNPTANSITTPQSDAASSATNQDTASGTSTSEAGPYSGKRYFDHPIYVSLHDWLDGGGSELNYYWRPAREAGF